MKSGWERYATEKRYIQKGYLRKYCNRSKIRKAGKASSCDCVQQSRQEKQEIEPLSLDLQELKAKDVEWYGKVVQLNEEGVYTGEEDGNGESRRGEHTQQENPDGGKLDVQNVPRKRAKRRRKTDSDQRLD